MKSIAYVHECIYVQISYRSDLFIVREDGSGIKETRQIANNCKEHTSVKHIHFNRTFQFIYYHKVLKIVNKTKTNCNIYVSNCLTNLHSNWTHLKICCLNMIYSPFCIDIYEGEEIYQVLTLINRQQSQNIPKPCETIENDKFIVKRKTEVDN